MSIWRQLAIFSCLPCEDIGAVEKLGNCWNVLDVAAPRERREMPQRSNFNLTKCSAISTDSCEKGGTFGQEGAYQVGVFFKISGVAMMVFDLMGVLVGAVLGLRFKVFALIPVICGALIIVVVGGVARGDEWLRLALAMSVISTAVQLGYILGLVLSEARARNHSRVSVPTSAGMSGLP